MNSEDKILQLLEAQQAELQKINARLDGMDARLDSMDARLDRLEEYAEVTRGGVNALIEWAEEVSNAIRFPLPKLK